MANVKITGLPVLGAKPADADVIEIIDDVAGTPTSKKVTMAHVREDLLENVVEDPTPQLGGDLDAQGKAITGAVLTESLAQGVTWDESADEYTRTGSIADVEVSQSAGNSRLIIQSAMRRCILNDSGQVVYYLDPDDSAKNEFGAASNLDGTDGQVMVEIPKFYFKYSYSGTTHSWSISPTRLPEYNLHPAFYKNGEEVDYRYIGAYEGSLYDASESGMVDDADIETDMYETGDKLCSISDEYPKTNETRAEFRAAAAQRGTGWRQQDYDLVSAIQLLYLIEFADWNSQEMIGMGRTQFGSGSWEAANQGDGMYIGQCGYSNSDGNGTNATDRDSQLDISSVDTTEASYQDYMTYRGIENFFGNIWKWVDGINIDDNKPHVCNDDTNFADDDDPAIDYIDLDITLANSNGYQKTLGQISRGFLPSAVGGGGSSSTYITDYYYQNSGWRVAILGGTAYYGTNAGVAYWALSSDSSSDSVHIGGRLAY